MGDRRSYYEILGLEPAAGPEEIREAFRRLARERHPDRFQGDERSSAEHEFQMITEAYNVLSEPESRGQYDQTLFGSSPTARANPKEIAKALTVNAAVAARNGELKRAEELFRQAVGHDPENARAQHMFGMFLADKLGQLDEALRCVDHASKLDPMNPRVLLDASKLFARAGMVTRAARLARAAAELSPGDEAVESWIIRLEEERARG